MKVSIRALWQGFISIFTYVLAILIILYIIILALFSFVELIDITRFADQTHMQKAPAEIIKIYADAFEEDIFFIIELIAMLLLGLFLLNVIKEEKGVSILAFEIGSAYKEKYTGKDIANILAMELQNVKKIHDFCHNLPEDGGSLLQTKCEALGYDEIKTEDLDYYMTNLGTIEAGSISLPLGQILIGIRRFFPGSHPGKVISGSLQKMDTSPVLKMNLISDSFCWEVSLQDIKDVEINKKDDNERQIINELIKEISYKIAFHFSQRNIGAKTFKGFERFTRALDNYYKYSLTGDLEDLERAEICCIKSLETEPYYDNPITLLLKIGGVYSDRKDFDKAKVIFLKIVEHRPDDISALVWLGYVLELNGKGNEAERYYKAASKLDPKSDYERNNRGYALTWLNMHNEAIQCYNEIISRNPKYPYVYKNNGRSLLLSGNITEAIKNFKKSIENFKKYRNYLMASSISVELGRAYCWSGNFDDAKETFKEALKLDPKNIEARIALAACYRRESKISITDCYEQGCDSEAMDSNKYIQCEIIKGLIQSEIKPIEITQARYHAVCGSLQKCLELLKVALDNKQCNIIYIKKDVDFEYLRNEEGFKVLLKTYDPGT